jgi:DNA-binding NarL/FixJ family response regulator
VVKVFLVDDHEFLLDDHEVVRRGLIDLLSADAELEVVGEAGSVPQASNCAGSSCPSCRIFGA